MIIKALIDLIYGVFYVLTAPISIPTMPDQVKEFIAIALDYITSGFGIVANYVNLPYLITLFGIVLAVDVGMLIYRLVIWVMNKIPMLDLD